MPKSVIFSRAVRTGKAYCLFILGFTGTSMPLWAQSSEQNKSAAQSQNANDPAEGLAQDKSTVTQLEVASAQMREYLKKMRVLAIKYHLEDEGAHAKELGAEWRKMLSGGHRLHDKMIQAAMADFRDKPDIKGQAGVFLLEVTGRNADADRFDNMFEVVRMLKDHGAEGNSFNLCFGLTAAANNEFAAAKPHLEIAASNMEQGAQELMKSQKISEDERNSVGQKLMQAYDMVKDLSQTAMYEKLWQEELKAREADAAGEPLPRVLIETTKGEIVVELFENNAPNTVANFIELCEKKYYDGLPFHRVLTHFMAQGGDPARDGSGGPGYCIATELNGQTDRHFFRGTLGMAMSERPNSGGSQFYICYMPRAHLNGKYVAFGRVVEGMNVLSDFAHIDPDKKDSEKEHSNQSFPDEIISATVLRKRAHEYKVNKLPEPTAPHAH